MISKGEMKQHNNNKTIYNVITATKSSSWFDSPQSKQIKSAALYSSGTIGNSSSHL